MKPYDVIFLMKPDETDKPFLLVPWCTYPGFLLNKPPFARYTMHAPSLQLQKLYQETITVKSATPIWYTPTVYSVGNQQ